MRNKLYAMLTTRCNLTCPHCDIRDEDDNFDREKFMKQLLDFDGNIIMFGGEPTYYLDRFFDVALSEPAITEKIVSVSTNLMILNEQLIEFYKTRGLATSWNRYRFIDQQYRVWLHNQDELAYAGVKAGVLITLTDDLIDMGPNSVLSVIREWNYKSIRSVKFEYFIGDTDDHYIDRADMFMAEIYKIWDVPIEMKNAEMTKHWEFNCDGVMTLRPNGELLYGCPHHSNTIILNECLTCEKAATCRPCRIQRTCSFPKRLAAAVAEKEGSLI